jgi:hypothetical protein
MQLTDEQYRALKKLIAGKDLSLSSAIRQAVDLWLSQTDRSRKVERSLASLGRFRSGKRDVSRRHDEYLAEIYSGRPHRRRK